MVTSVNHSHVTCTDVSPERLCDYLLSFTLEFNLCVCVCLCFWFGLKSPVSQLLKNWKRRSPKCQMLLSLNSVLCVSGGWLCFRMNVDLASRFRKSWMWMNDPSWGSIHLYCLTVYVMLSLRFSSAADQTGFECWCVSLRRISGVSFVFLLRTLD